MLALLDSAKLGLDAAFHPDGYNVGINDGEAAGQTVEHETDAIFDQIDFAIVGTRE